MLKHNSFIKAEVKICRLRIVKNRENLNGDLPHFAPKNDKLP